MRRFGSSLRTKGRLMRYSEYGRTGKRVSAVGFGGMRFDVKRPLEENADLLRYASECGVNYFDTAPSYCEDQSEDIFGLAFKSMPKPFYASTKGMPTEFDTADKARDAVRRSLDRLGLARIDFYHVWCLRTMEHFELAMRKGGQYEGLLRCKEEGLIGHIVCSSHQPGCEVRQILAGGHFDGVLLGVNILNFPYRWDGVLAARERGCGVVAMNPLAGGAVPQHEEEFAFLAGAGETPTEAALRFLVGCPEITVALVGITTREHIDLACRVADNPTALTQADLDRIQAHLGENLNEVCTGCGYCRDCPQNIPVPNYMQFYNEKAMFGKTDGEMRKALEFQYTWGLLVGRHADAAACVECDRCEEACTQHLPIQERLKEVAAWEAASDLPG